MTDFGAGRAERLDDVQMRALTAHEIAADEDNLTAAVAGLWRLMAGSLKLEDLLTHVAHFAVRAIPGAEGAGVTMYESGTAATVVASAPFVREVDDIQYGLGEGLCISAAEQQRIICCGSLGGTTLWRRFGPRAGRLGVHSVLSLPLLLPEQVVGAINLYAHAKNAFDEHAAQLGELFAAPAAAAVHNARVLAQAQRTTEQLQATVSSRATIDQAIGILISRSGDTAQDAFDALRTISQTENTKLTAVAAHVVTEAARRARHIHATITTTGPAPDPRGNGRLAATDRAPRGRTDR